MVSLFQVSGQAVEVRSQWYQGLLFEQHGSSGVLNDARQGSRHLHFMPLERERERESLNILTSTTVDGVFDILKAPQ